MNNNIIPIIVTCNDSRRIIAFNPTLTLQALETSTKDEFEPPFGDIKIFSAKLKVEVTVVQFIKEEEEYYIEHSMEVVHVQLDRNKTKSTKVDLQDIADNVYREEELIHELNQWAFNNKFKLVISEGKNILKKEIDK